jgi:enoyl-CoA hydratase/carnithine racemase
MSTINYAIDENAIATITLNRDEKRNAFNHEMAERFRILNVLRGKMLAS